MLILEELKIINQYIYIKYKMSFFTTTSLMNDWLLCIIIIIQNICTELATLYKIIFALCSIENAMQITSRIQKMDMFAV